MGREKITERGRDKVGEKEKKGGWDFLCPIL